MSVDELRKSLLGEHYDPARENELKNKLIEMFNINDINKDLTYLFMGDSTKVVEEKRNWPDVDVLKVGHHGSNTSSTEKFLNQVSPEISVISVGEGNSYELPKEKILNRLEKIGTTIYRTDRDGTIQIISDGISNEVVKIDVNFDSSAK